MPLLIIIPHNYNPSSSSPRSTVLAKYISRNTINTLRVLSFRFYAKNTNKVVSIIRAMSTILHLNGIDNGSDNKNAGDCDRLLSPAAMANQIPLSSRAEKTVRAAREACANVISGIDDRLIVVVGPCSIHDPEQALVYARKLKACLGLFPDLVILMRSYFEKPRTTVGWKGLINDPELNGTFQIQNGLFTARKLLKDLTDLGLPLAIELLDTFSPQYLSDFISWGAIGARTTESQPHREIASKNLHSVGFKNGTDGSISVAIDAMKSASSPHSFIGMNRDGVASIVRTEGNPSVHVVLRGGAKGPNYSEAHVAQSIKSIYKQLPDKHPSIMIDCSHGNSEKDHRNQPKVVHSICEQLKAGNPFISGVMIESNINEGRQDLPSKGPVGLKYGVSITDACINFETTLTVLEKLQEAVVQRRKLVEGLSEDTKFLVASNLLSVHFE
ncbi:3-deoxy-7-phosphoheptulonate synthase [Puccinia striiformis f. sp. tritici PST-78]|uniref:3-deoxy-7-phosphoheptulonate synthase n=1 Tax=Puccinia striiformis f. sp. tritici PST-78 TaxID=1165861 RepID=A0A0L0V4T6_9BASI|nr:3-deoxy-7-phosphoheptulonate synthase [Puccinia striiformis f. sp. tritici PST-78]